MKIHRNLAEAAATGLDAVFNRGEVASRLVERTLLEQKKWGARDRAFFAETVYEVIRWRRTLEFLAQSGAIWDLLGAHWVRQHFELPAWEEWLDFSTRQIKEREKLVVDAPRAIRESLPDWLDELGEKQLEGRWSQEIRALNRPAPIFLRTNTLKISRDDLYDYIKAQNISTQEVEDVPAALKVINSKTIRPAMMREGYFEIQDAGSQHVAPFLQPQAGQKIIDACAGAGGKTLHLAALTNNEAEIWAFDVSGRKLNELARRANRAGAVVQIAKIDEELIATHCESADRVLLDVPCSGTGTLRRQPDLKWRLSPEFLAETSQLQRQLLMNYSQLVKPGGELVYATCSILPEENERQVEWFIKQNDGFELASQKWISTFETEFDGFFMARLKRK